MTVIIVITRKRRDPFLNMLLFFSTTIKINTCRNNCKDLIAFNAKCLFVGNKLLLTLNWIPFFFLKSASQKLEIKRVFKVGFFLFNGIYRPDQCLSLIALFRICCTLEMVSRNKCNEL